MFLFLCVHREREKEPFWGARRKLTFRYFCDTCGTRTGSILAQLNVTAPHIVSAINANRQAFLALLNEPIASSAGGGVLRRIERERCGELTERLRKAEGDEDEDMEGDEGEMEFEDDEMGGQGVRALGWMVPYSID